MEPRPMARMPGWLNDLKVTCASYLSPGLRNYPKLRCGPYVFRLPMSNSMTNSMAMAMTMTMIMTPLWPVFGWLSRRVDWSVVLFDVMNERPLPGLAEPDRAGQDRTQPY